MNVSSVASFIFSAYNVNYCATKAYLTSFSEGLAAELAGTGVQVQALCPGFTRSEFHQRMELDVGDIPGWMWMSATSVVDDLAGDAWTGAGRWCACPAFATSCWCCCFGLPPAGSSPG